MGEPIPPDGEEHSSDEFPSAAAPPRSTAAEPSLSTSLCLPGSTKKVVFRDLSFETTVDELDELFGPYGVEDCRIDFDSQDRSKGTGELLFSSPREAALACQQFNGRFFNGKRLFMALDRARGEGEVRSRTHADGRKELTLGARAGNVVRTVTAEPEPRG